jgi:UDP-glucose 4-epimerase
MILIVGGAGYIGSHVNKLLNKLGYKTVVFDNLVTGYEEFVKWGELFKGDLSDINQIRACFDKYQIDSVMNFSGYINVGESVLKPDKYYFNNVSNTLNLLNVMREYSVNSFIFSSTAAIFGMPIEIPISEVHPKDPINPYGKTKLMMEMILKDYDEAYGLKYVNLRYFNAAGADFDCEVGENHQPESHLIPLAIYAALGKRDDLKIYGTDYDTKDGTCVRDYIHVNDLAMAHVKALEYIKETRESNAFNLGNGQGFSVREIVDTVKKVSGKDFKVLEVDRRAGDPSVLIASSEKARQVLQWQPENEDIETIVESAYKWHVSGLSQKS